MVLSFIEFKSGISSGETREITLFSVTLIIVLPILKAPSKFVNSEYDLNFG
mgnify:CR=1 FL=1